MARNVNTSRRKILQAMASLPLLSLPVSAHAAQRKQALTRAVPSTGEKLPVVGIGSWQTINSRTRDSTRAILRRFLELGGKLVDTSPMYGEAEAIIGELLQELNVLDEVFLATKVWTTGKSSGQRQIAESERLLRRTPLDLIQVHNLVDLATQLQTLRNMKDSGKLRYIGITHYTASAHDDLQRVIEREDVDFIQVNFNLVERNAARSLLPAARDRGVAVIVNRPYAGGRLFSRVRGQPLPAWAADLNCTSFGQIFLKYILGNPATTVVIPATRKLHHLEDNMGALHGPVPGADQVRQIERWFDAL